MILIIALIFILVLWGVKTNPEPQNNFSKHECDSFRGAGCIFVFIAHTLGRVLSENGLTTIDKPYGCEFFSYDFFNILLNSFGALAVGMFFMLSGYGLALQFKKNNNGYLKKMYFFKMPKIYLILILTNILFYLVNFLKSDLPAVEVALRIFGFEWIDRLNGASWYLNTLLVLYLSFSTINLICYKVKNKDLVLCLSAAIPVVVMSVIIFTYNRYGFNVGIHMRGIFCFMLGTIYFIFKPKIDSLLLKYGKYFVLFSILPIIIFQEPLEVMQENISCFLFCVDLIYFSLLFTNKNKVLKWFSSISLYFYIFNFLFIDVLLPLIKINWFLYFLVMCVTTILVAVIWTYADKYTTIGIKKLFTRNKLSKK